MRRDAFIIHQPTERGTPSGECEILLRRTSFNERCKIHDIVPEGINLAPKGVSID